jgi:hypothetical protein
MSDVVPLVGVDSTAEHGAVMLGDNVHGFMRCDCAMIGK